MTGISERKQELLKKIAKLLDEYENQPDGYSNDTMAEISFDFGREVYIFNGESFDRAKPWNVEPTED